MAIINNPLVSIIVPVYGTEKLLSRCLDSILNQTYKNLEIIVVNDCSPGKCKEIVKQYQSMDSRVKYVEHEKNKGLFHARLTGAKHMSGDYIAFVDSDDYIAVDYYRLLVKEAQAQQADIVCANMIMVNESDGRHYINLLNRPSGKILKGEEILKAYFEQEGLAFHWHAVWNKIYSKQLWDKALPHYSKIKSHLIMAEDFAYSTVLFHYAQKYVSIEYEGYYYFQNSNASTSLSGNLNKYLKNLTDLGTAFNFVENFLFETKQLKKYEEKFKAWKARYSRFWTDNIENSALNTIDKNKAFNQLKKAFKINTPKKSISSDHYFYSTSIDWDDRFEKLKKEILKEEYEFISFDVFDTLIYRPFMDPHDLFVLLDYEYEKLTKGKTITKFSKLRREAEALVRKELKLKKPLFEDITLDEIYHCLIKDYSIDKDIASELKKKEIQFELKYCKARKSAKELFDMAIEVGKKVVIISDMYLPKEIIEQILNKNGYSGYERLFVSSDLRLSKNHGSLFEFVLKELDCDPSKLLHIGDNWEVDVVNAKNKGISAYFYPKAIHRMLNWIPDKDTGNSTLLYFNPRGKWHNYEYSKEYFLIRCMLAVVANKYFDNPYRTFSKYSDFNGDPYFVGYYALGMHVLAISKWILEDAIDKGYKKIHFVARDGFLPKKAYDHLSKCYVDSPDSNYLYLSRKALIPALIDNINVLYLIKDLIRIEAFTPRKFFRIILRQDITKKLSNYLQKSGINLDKKFKDIFEYTYFVKVLKTINIDLSELKKYKSTLIKYLNENVKSNEALFDIGYSGTSQMIMAELGVKTDAYYIHINKDTALKYGKKFGYNVTTFYSYSPSISGTLREYMISETGPSCIGYNEHDNKVLPVFEKDEFSYIEQFIIGTMHYAAEEFVKDLVNEFSEYIPKLFIRNEDASMPYEMFLHSAKDHDRKLFAECYFEDEAYHGKSKINLMNEWRQATNYHMTALAIEELPYKEVVKEIIDTDYTFLNHRHKYMKALFYFLYNRDIFKHKVKSKFSNRPMTLKLMEFTYRNLRNFKRAVFGPR